MSAQTQQPNNIDFGNPFSPADSVGHSHGHGHEHHEEEEDSIEPKCPDTSVLQYCWSLSNQSLQINT